MEAKAIKSIDLIALACLIISQDHQLIDRSPSGAIPIVYDDRDGRRRERSQRPRRHTSRCLLRRLTRREISPRYQTLSTEGDHGPPEVSDVRADDGGGPWPSLPPGGSGVHGPPPSSARTSLASGGPGTPSVLRVLYCKAILISRRVSRLSRRRRRTARRPATAVSIVVNGGDGAAGAGVY